MKFGLDSCWFLFINFCSLISKVENEGKKNEDERHFLKFIDEIFHVFPSSHIFTKKNYSTFHYFYLPTYSFWWKIWKCNIPHDSHDFLFKCSCTFSPPLLFRLDPSSSSIIDRKFSEIIVKLCYMWVISTYNFIIWRHQCGSRSGKRTFSGGSGVGVKLPWRETKFHQLWEWPNKDATCVQVDQF